MINARLDAGEMEWLERVADERGLTLSGALRHAIWLARQFELARRDYRERGGAKRDADTRESAPWAVLLAYDLETLGAEE